VGHVPAGTMAARGYVRLDVGGVRYTTHLATLTRVQGSMLATMFGRLETMARSNTADKGSSGTMEPSHSGDIGLLQDDSGAYVIDRDGDSFRYILNYLRRCGPGLDPVAAHVLPDASSERAQLAEEANYFMLEELAWLARPPQAEPAPELAEDCKLPVVTHIELLQLLTQATGPVYRTESPSPMGSVSGPAVRVRVCM
jgi:hypothetical protein